VGTLQRHAEGGGGFSDASEYLPFEHADEKRSRPHDIRPHRSGNPFVVTGVTTLQKHQEGGGGFSDASEYLPFEHADEKQSRPQDIRPHRSGDATETTTG
jgi:hypothetical protein